MGLELMAKKRIVPKRVKKKENKRLAQDSIPPTFKSGKE